MLNVVLRQCASSQIVKGLGLALRREKGDCRHRIRVLKGVLDHLLIELLESLDHLNVLLGI